MVSPAQSQPSADAGNQSLYKELHHSDSIRILAIKPSIPDDPIVCSVEEARLSESAPFEALSYTWAFPEEQTEQLQRIECNGESFQVRPNLWHALRRLRLPDRCRYIWVDAICINQNNLRERGAQVRLMGQIYTHASRVLIWLGIDADNYSETAFRAVCHNVNEWCTEKEESERADFTVSTSFPICRSFNPPEDPRSWKPVATLYMNAWFRRIWVIQEAALGSSAIVIWGRSEISWRWVGLAVTSQSSSFGDLLGREAADGVRNAKLIYSISRTNHTGNGTSGRSFFDLLKMSRGFEASDPRDKIYGLLGLSTADNSPDNQKLFIEPDYTMSFDDLLKKLADKMMESSVTLEVLSSVQHAPELDSRPQNVPSWVPRWDTEYTTLFQDRRKFKASKSFPMRLDRNIQGSVLKVESLQICRISKIFPIISTVEAVGHSKDLRRFLYTDEHLSLLCRTLMAGKKSHTSWYKYSEPGVSELTHIEHNVPRDAHSNMLMLVNMRPRPSPLDWRLNYKSNMNTLEDWFAPCVKRRLAVTENGFLVLGPAVMEEGDFVCILAGADVPFVLRKTTEEFWLAGEAYVEGLMEGEGVEAALNGSPIEGPLAIKGGRQNSATDFVNLVWAAWSQLDNVWGQ